MARYTLRGFGVLATVTLLGLWSVAARGIDPAVRCEADKLKTAGKYDFCRLNEEAKAAKTFSSPDFGKCDAKFSDKWGTAETRAMGQCSSNGDGASIQALITQHTDLIALKLGAGPRFVDNANGTITDNQTGLTWEKKVKLDGTVDFANPRDANNAYQWAGYCSILTSKFCQPSAAASALCTAKSENGTTGCAQCGGGEGTCIVGTTTAWALAVDANTASFGGNTDWRLPKREELVSIVDYADTTTFSPATFAAFQGASCGGACTDITNPACSCTAYEYWSASSWAPIPDEAWFVEFDFSSGSGDVVSGDKMAAANVRLVSGGS